MNQMEEIKKLYAKEREYKIPEKPKEGQEQIKVKIMPLALDKVSELKNLEEGASMKDVADNAKSLFSMSLEITPEEAGKLSFEFMEDLLAAVMDANNFKEEDMKKTGIKDFIATKKKQIQEQKEKIDGQPDTAAPEKSPGE